MEILINEITGNSLCKHLNSCIAFLIRREDDLFKGILLALKILIMCDHPLLDTVENMPSHT